MEIKKLHTDAKLPVRGNDHAAGIDFFSLHDVTLPPNYYSREGFPVSISAADWRSPAITIVKTGIAVAIPSGCVGLFRDRSSYGGKGVIITAGVIDSDYRGEIMICMSNLNPFPVEIPAGSKIGQMLIMRIDGSRLEIVEELPASSRGDKGFGSTGN